MQEILATAAPDQIIIETTGVADVPPIVAGLEAIDLAADAIITVVDAESFLNIEKREPVVTRQVRAADFIVLNKGDLVDGRALQKLERRIRRANPDAAIVPTCWGQVQSDVLFGGGSRAERAATLADDDRSGVDGSGIGSFVFEATRPLSRERFLKLIRRWPHDLYRCKGFMYFAGEEHPRLFNYTCGRVHMEWVAGSGPATEPGTRLVFIGKRPGKLAPRMMATLRSCEVGSPRKGIAAFWRPTPVR